MTHHRAIMWKHDVIHKTGSMYRISTPTGEDRFSLIGNMHKDGSSSALWFSSHASEQTNRHTHRVTSHPSRRRSKYALNVGNSVRIASWKVNNFLKSPRRHTKVQVVDMVSWCRSWSFNFVLIRSLFNRTVVNADTISLSAVQNILTSSWWGSGVLWWIER